MTMLYLGLDIGTSVIKASAFDDAGDLVTTARESVSIVRRHAGWAEQDPLAVWRAVARCVRRVAAANLANEWRAVGVAAQGDGCWLVDEDLRPVAPAALWMDGRAAQLVESWVAEGTDRAYFAATANVPFPGAVPALLRWYEIHEPETLRRARWLLSCADWVVARLTGSVTTDHVNAARSVRDTGHAGWSPTLAASIGLGDWSHLLPPSSPSAGLRGAVTPPAARETSLPVGLPVMAASLDVAATMVGAGAAVPGDAVTILGTTALSAVVSEQPVLTPDMIGFNTAMPWAGWARSMAAMAGTTNADWAAQVLGLRGSGADHRFFDLAESAPPGAGGALFLPFIAPGGERAPFVQPAARAGFFGLDASADRATLARAVIEGVGLAVRHCHAFLPHSSDPVWITGGGARSRMWCQVIADLLRRPVVRADVSEPGALGIVMTAAVALGDRAWQSTTMERRIQRGQTFEPGPAADAYDELYSLYVRVIADHRELWDIRAKTVWPARGQSGG